MKKKGAGEAEFGVSLLDMLCSGMGAVVLLIVLSNVQSKARLDSAKAALGEVMQQNLAITEEVEKVEEQAAWLGGVANNLPESPGEVAGDLSGRLQLMPQGGMTNVVIVMDVSGSMSRYYPDTPKYAGIVPEMKAPGPKWAQAVQTVRLLLSSSPTMQRFVILRLDDDRSGRCGAPLVSTGRSRWLPGVETDGRPHRLAVVFAKAMAELANVVPEGGSNHGRALEEAFRYVKDRTFLAGEPSADTIILITDGLPNHGAAANEPVHPEPRSLVSPQSKGIRRQVVRELVDNAFRTLRQAGWAHVKLHVVCLPWPDDVELHAFALEIAAPSGGLVLSLPLVKAGG